jgi:signal transduction histidine kinase
MTSGGLRAVRGGVPRAVIAAGVLTALTGALLIAWFVSGWADVRARQAAVRTAPVATADQRAGELAHELRGELASLLQREVDRPYFHYQNLFHDPGGSAGLGVAPSPLARVGGEPLVAGYFQLDGKGRTSTPTINDDVPAASEPTRLADHTRFRDEVARSLAAPLAPPASVRIATHVTVAPPPRRVAVAPRPPRVAVAPPPTHVAVAPPVPSTQVVTIDRNSYAQNNASNDIFIAQQTVPSLANAQRANPAQANAQQQLPAPAPAEPAQAPARAGAPAQPPAALAPVRTTPPIPPPEPQPITITVSPLQWRTLDFAGQPAIVAVRLVATPDGELAQGFVVDRTALTSWLARHAGDAVAELRTGDHGATEIVPGWHLEVAANPRALIAADADARALGRGFVVRFIAAAIIALLAAVLVVWLVARAERLARERSQFAAAAAHELRTPLAGLQLYGDMLADGLGDPTKLRDYARRMSEEAARLGRVVSNVLGFSQLERGNLSVEPRPDALADALRELADRAEPALDRAGAALAVELSPDLRATFDRDALARIVGNLLDNAEKYSRSSADRTITLAAHARPDAVEIVVSDHGPGIAAPARLFRPFARGVPTDGPAGLGLGLALSQSLARAMHGELTYRAAPGGGAAFVLTLPPA